MHRNILKFLVDRFSEPISKPLILRGARQVGKSYLVRMLARELGINLIEVNFEKTKIREIDNQEDFSIEKVLAEIQLVFKRTIDENSLLFLDEIQAQPNALNALRYFYEDKPGLKVIAAGSLLEVAMHSHDFTMPVGRVDYCYLGPMTFSEFLVASGDELLLEQIKSIQLNKGPLKVVHEQAIAALKKYYFVGGMPEAVKTFVDTGDFGKVRAVQQSLVNTYQDDIPKYSEGKHRDLISLVFNYAVQHLGQQVVFSEVSKTHSSQVRAAIERLSQANVISTTFHNRSSGLPLKAGEVNSTMKLYLLDVGLYNAMTGLAWEDLIHIPPDKLLTKGSLSEQFVAQHLLYRASETELKNLYYWQRGAKKGAAEIDFVIAEGGQIFPLEVKSGPSGKMRSLWQFAAEKESKLCVRLDLSLRNNLISSISHKVSTSSGVAQVNCELLGLPLYAIEKLADLLLASR